jgi:hypothetical protein
MLWGERQLAGLSLLSNASDNYILGTVQMHAQDWVSEQLEIEGE